MSNLTRFFLVVLRLAIGWLFLFEGFEKLEVRHMPAAGWKKPWTSAGYLKQSYGPLSPFYLWQVGGDPDARTLAMLAVNAAEPDQDPAQARAGARAPQALKEAWQAYLDRFAVHYQLDPEQRKMADTRLEQALDNAVRWIEDARTTRETPRGDFPTASFTAKETPAGRVAAYRTRMAEIRQIQDEVLPAFSQDIYGPKLRTLKADAATQRADLIKDLEAPYLDSLQSVLTPEQKARPLLPPEGPPQVLRLVDQVVMWGVFLVGVGLLFGVFSRLSALVGALFLISLHLALPALPWGPENPKFEGNYFFVTKNLITALALLVLATVPSGRWFGLDGLLQFLNPWRWRSLPAEPADARAVTAHASR